MGWTKIISVLLSWWPQKQSTGQATPLTARGFVVGAVIVLLGVAGIAEWFFYRIRQDTKNTLGGIYQQYEVSQTENAKLIKQNVELQIQIDSLHDVLVYERNLRLSPYEASTAIKKRYAR